MLAVPSPWENKLYEKKKTIITLQGALDPNRILVRSEHSRCVHGYMGRPGRNNQRA